VEEILDELVGCLDSKALPLLQWKEELSFVESRLPAGAWAWAAPRTQSLRKPMHAQPGVAIARAGP
jgi:hypothetical protein